MSLAIENIIDVMDYEGEEELELILSEFICQKNDEIQTFLKDKAIEIAKNNNPQIPWGKIMGFRNGIVHEYGKTDYTIVYEVATKNLFPLRDVLVKTKWFNP